MPVVDFFGAKNFVVKKTINYPMPDRDWDGVWIVGIVFGRGTKPPQRRTMGFVENSTLEFVGSRSSIIIFRKSMRNQGRTKLKGSLPQKTAEKLCGSERTCRAAELLCGVKPHNSNESGEAPDYAKAQWLSALNA